jgi:hypothetical protein
LLVRLYYRAMRTRYISLSTLMLLAGCSSLPSQHAVEPDLKLLESSQLIVPQDCLASGSFVVSYTVATTGRTAAIRAPEAPRCVQDALTAWVASFRYEPPSIATPAAMEWLMVTARRGT